MFVFKKRLQQKTTASVAAVQLLSTLELSAATVTIVSNAALELSWPDLPLLRIRVPYVPVLTL